MKKNILVIAVAITAFIFAGATFWSCSDSPNEISNRKIKKLYNQYLKENALDQEFCTVDIGYYETTPEERCRLKKLEAAGLITVNLERFAWWEKRIGTKKVAQTSYDWWGFAHTSYVSKKVNEYVFEDHIMATVALTPAGEKLIVKDQPKAAEKKDKDMVQPDFNPEKYPECAVSCEEDWPVIKNPFIEEKKEEATPTQSEKKKEADTQKEEPVKEVVENVERRDSTKYAAYQNALEKENRTTCTLKGCSVKVVKARNIQIINENGVANALAEIIIENKNVSDAYRVDNGIINGTKTSRPVILTYYLDKGWVIVENPTLEFTEKYIEQWAAASSAIGKQKEDADEDEEASDER